MERTWTGPPSASTTSADHGSSSSRVPDTRVTLTRRRRGVAAEPERDQFERAQRQRERSPGIDIQRDIVTLQQIAPMNADHMASRQVHQHRSMAARPFGLPQSHDHIAGIISVKVRGFQCFHDHTAQIMVYQRRHGASGPLQSVCESLGLHLQTTGATISPQVPGGDCQ